MPPKSKLYSTLGAMTIGSIASSTSLLPISFVYAEGDSGSVESGDHRCGGEKKCGGDKKPTGSTDNDSSEDSQKESK